VELLGTKAGDLVTHESRRRFDAVLQQHVASVPQVSCAAWRRALASELGQLFILIVRK
jgi:hypothetical protein